MPYDEPLRPQIHFSPRRNWMNDPNGCVYYNGLYHLYFQHHPFDTNWGPMHWGHATSPDLVHWTQREIALYPDDRLGMAFSGSVVIDRDNRSGLFPSGSGLVAIYTSHLPATDTRPAVQQQSLAYSRDGGDSWVSYTHNPIIENPGIPDFRDPKVFYHSESDAYVMILVAGTEVWLYRSIDLVRWEFASRFGRGHGNQGGVWECPDLFALPHPDRPSEHVWVLAVSCMGPPDLTSSPLQYFIGEFDGYTFTNGSPAEHIRLLDRGHDFYATQSWHGIPASSRRTVWIGWANHWAYAGQTPTDPWRGVMSLPRTLELGTRDDDLVLKQRPVAELDDLVESTAASIPPEAAVDVQGNGAHHVTGAIRRAGTTSGSIHFSFGPGEDLIVTWDGPMRRLTLDRSTVGSTCTHPAYAAPATAVLPEVGDLDIRVVVDRSLVEIFALDGEVVFTSQIFPDHPLSTVAARGFGDAAALSCAPLSSIWNNNVNERSPVGDSEEPKLKGGTR